ncbi:hypothetical protein ACQP1W_24925 [Spirillospora sp. CA-255316]
MAPLQFATRGIVPLGYAGFAFVLGVVVGLLVRRTIPAMAITLAIFAAVQVAMPLARPLIFAPTETTPKITMANLEAFSRSGTLKLKGATSHTGDWVISSRVLDSKGNNLGDTITVPNSGPCPPKPQPGGGGSPGGVEPCLAELNRLGYHMEMSYLPSSRFTTIQAAETGLYLALAAGLSGFCFWWIRRRLN